MSSAPILADITVNGRAIKAVAVAGQAGVPVRLRSRHRPAGVADRRAAGAAVRRAGREDQPDAAVPDQAAGRMPGTTLKVPDDLIDFTPELRAQALKNIERYKVAPWMYNPPVLGNVNGILGAINMGNAVGGTNWPGVAYDPETHTIIAQREQRRHHVGVARAAAAELLGYPVRVGRRRPAVPGSARTRRLLRRRFAARAGAGRSAARRQPAPRRRRRAAAGRPAAAVAAAD